MAEEQTEHATMSQVKAMIRRKKRRHPEHGSHGLNIYPMMDMMTILLVFMVMQFASSTAAVIQESSELRLPYSTSPAQLGEAVPVQISRGQIVVDGTRVVDLRNGTVDASDKQGGSTGFLITPLYRELTRIRDLRKLIAERNPSRPFTHEVQILADYRTPFRTLSEVIYTLGQTEFSKLHFVSNSADEIGRTPADLPSLRAD